MKRILAFLAASTAPLAAAAGAWSGVALHSTADQRTVSEGFTAAGTGPRAALAATAASEIASLNTFGASSAAADIRRWLGATAGPLRDDIAASAPATVDRITADGASARGTVTDLAVTSFDASAPTPTATVIAMVRVDVVPKTGAAASDRRRLAAGLTRTGPAWQLTSLTAIPAGASQDSVGGGVGAASGVGTDPVLAAAASILDRIFSYGPGTPPAAGADLEGAAAGQYRALAGALADQIRSQGLALTTHVVAAGFTSRGAANARVLVFLDQTSTRDGGSPTVAAGAVAVTLRLDAGRWRIVSLTAE